MHEERIESLSRHGGDYDKSSKKLVEEATGITQPILAANGFDEHITLKVWQAMMKDPKIREYYETTIGCDAYQHGVDKKSPLNQTISANIKKITEAETQRHSGGKPKLQNVKGEPIQSYSLLTQK